MVEVSNRQVTFIPPAQARFLIGDFTDWDKRPLPISEPIRLEFPAGAYLEYAFMDEAGRPFPDPDNPHKAQNPWWTYPRAVELPGFRFEAPPLPHGEGKGVHRHRLESKVYQASRRYYVYEPSGEPSATLYVQDGVAYYRTAQFADIAEALCERGEIQPIRMVFVEPEDRTREYTFDERYERFLLEELIPAVESQYGPTPERALWGASLGGLVSAWIAFRNPDKFQKVGTQSACLTAEPGSENRYTAPEWLTAQYAQAERLPLRFYCETGQIEWLLAPNRRFAALLADKGYPHAYLERKSGHNWMTWRQGLAPGLRFLFGR